MLGLRVLPCRHWAKLIHPHTYSLSSSFSSFPASACGEDGVTAPNKSRSPAPGRPRGARGCGGGRRPGGCRRPELRPRRRRPRDGAAPPVSSRGPAAARWHSPTPPAAPEGPTCPAAQLVAKRTAASLGGFYVVLLKLLLFSKSPGHVSLLSAPGALRGKAPGWAQPRAPGRGVCACPWVRVPGCVSVSPPRCPCAASALMAAWRCAGICGSSTAQATALHRL